MPKKVSRSELEAVLKAVTRFPEGASIQDISDVLGIALPRRTLQRRLTLLVEKKRLAVVGRGRGSRYLQLATPGIDSARHDQRADKVELEGYVPISTEVETLHEGNIARYRLRLSQYHTWKETWH